jgi:folylpolyglutamate synthase
MERTYPTALRLLNSLQSNFAVTSLFKPEPAASNEPKRDLNAQAIPEMLHWLKRAGYTPEDLAPLKTIHIAGTKGKGSVTALCTSILLRYPAAGRVGTYTSPHIVSVRERIMLDGQPISQELFTKYFFELWDRFEASALEAGETDVEGPGSKPFYFRYLTIMAWHVFLREGVRSMVMECGIGGEYDATNVIPSTAVTAAVVTKLGIDHVAMLGDTVDKIAWHKSGIFKPGVKAFLLAPQEGMDKVRERASEKGAGLVEVHDQLSKDPLLAEAKLQGPYVSHNMTLAAYAVREHLGLLGEHISFGKDNVPPELAEALQSTSLRGRSENFVDEPNNLEWYLDGAHTHDSLDGVAQWWIAELERGAKDTQRTCLLFNQQERDAGRLLSTMAKSIRHGFDLAVFSRNELDLVDGKPAGDLNVQLDACKTMRQLDRRTLAVSQSSVRAAVDVIRNYSTVAKEDGKTCKVLVTGSFHLVGAVLRRVDPNIEE